MKTAQMMALWNVFARKAYRNGHPPANIVNMLNGRNKNREQFFLDDTSKPPKILCQHGTVLDFADL
jgi:hypothetical protein